MYKIRNYYIKPNFVMRKLVDKYGFEKLELINGSYYYAKRFKKGKYLVEVFGKVDEFTIPKKLYFYKRINKFTFKPIGTKKSLIKDLIKEGVVIVKDE